MKTFTQQLSEWHFSHCNGEWEHRHGITIETCANPGWWVKINIRDTELENKPFIPVVHGDKHPTHPQGTWCRCYVEKQEYNGVGDPSQLDCIIKTFLAWANNVQSTEAS